MERLAGKAALVTGGACGIGLAVNVADQASVQAMVNAITGKHRRLDILVNNAGVCGNTPFL